MQNPETNVKRDPQESPGATRKAQKRVARFTAEQRFAPSARELFPMLRRRLLESRPVLAIFDEGRPGERWMYGDPTFRNVIENGQHV
jgi:hypothetical protein